MRGAFPFVENLEVESVVFGVGADAWALPKMVGGRED